MIMKLRVAETRPAASDVRLLRLVHPRRPQLPAFEAGAHVDLHIPSLGVRQYSLCGDPSDTGSYQIAVKLERAGRGGSGWLHSNLVEGAEIPVSAPRNHFPLANDGGRSILIAGGIGVTPLTAMAHVLVARGDDFVFHYCARDTDHAPLLDKLRTLCGARLHTWFASEGRRFDPAASLAGEVGAQIYACGPERLIDAVASQATATGHAAANLHTERFTALDDADFTPEPFDVVLGASGRQISVPSDRTLLSVLEDNGVALEFSCEIGVCGACECGYLAGDVIHRDVVLSPKQRTSRLMPCVSRAKGVLKLDV
jgi:ferredoxin-NADP reductase